MADTFKKFFSTLGDGSDKPKKTVLMMCLLIPITNTAHIAVFLCHCCYLFIYYGAFDLTSSQCTISDTQVTGKTNGPFVYFPYWTSRIHQEYISSAFQDKLNFRESTGRDRMYTNFMT